MCSRPQILNSVTLQIHPYIEFLEELTTLVDTDHLRQAMLPAHPLATIFPQPSPINRHIIR